VKVSQGYFPNTLWVTWGYFGRSWAILLWQFSLNGSLPIGSFPKNWCNYLGWGIDARQKGIMHRKALQIAALEALLRDDSLNCFHHEIIRRLIFATETGTEHHVARFLNSMEAVAVRNISQED
jgi:hypothetical protein